MLRFPCRLPLLRALARCGCLLLALCLPLPALAGTILVLGDSISAAYGMSLEQGWVAAMSGELAQKKPGARVVNASISGETSAGGLARLPGLLEQHRPDLVIIELGGNDGLRGYPLQQFRANLTALTDLSLAAGAKVILVPMEIPPNYGSRYTSGFRESFVAVAAATGARLSRFILDGVAVNPSLMQDDGIHPTAEAQPLLWQNLRPAVLDALDAA